MQLLEARDESSFRQIIADIHKPPYDAEAERRIQEKYAAVREIVDAVRARGDAAVAEFTQRFDGVALTPADFEVSRDEIESAVRGIDRDLIEALSRFHDNVRKFHEMNLRQSWQEEFEDGTILGQRITPLDSAGVYVPGGTAFYVSSAIMNVVPARVAGVNDIIVVSPPTHQGGVHPLILAAAHLAGATRVFRLGGAQAVAALAYGTEHVPAVPKITGPGNIYVTIAKRLVAAVCDIDKEAGPSEVVVVADASSDPRLVAFELLAQAEHDEDAVAILVTDAPTLAPAVREAIERELPTLSRAEFIRKSLSQQGRIYVVQDLEQAAEVTNAIAPEHLSIQTADSAALFAKIRHAGCAAVGDATPIAVGDYYAGPNHILPTGRRARYASPLTADDFRKITSIIRYSKTRLAAAYDDIRRIAEVEGFTAHIRAIEGRL